MKVSTTFLGAMPNFLWLRDPSKPLQFPLFLATHYPDRLPENAELVLITSQEIKATTRIWDPHNALIVALTRTQGDVAYGTSLTLAMIGSREGSRGNSILAEGERILEDLTHQTEMFALLNTIQDNLEGEEGARQAFMDVDVSQIMVDGVHAAFDIDPIPDTQQWCIERDLAWRHPLAHER